MKVMAIVAHPDDEIIGLGGTLAKHVKSGDEVKVVILGDGKTSRYNQYAVIDPVQKEESDQETTAALKALGVFDFIKTTLPDNRFDSLPLLDIVKIVSEQIQSFQPEIVYTHYYGDLNIDHQLTAEAVIIATRPIEYAAKKLLLFETLSSTEMSGPRNTHAFLPNVFINISNEIDQKLEAINCYQSELREFPHPRSLKAIQINAELWGAKSGFLASEPFVLFRENVT
jgi:LmbE family N-acetylglucosaminyl deacetylase